MHTVLARQPRVLVVDDDLPIRHMLQDALETSDCAVAEASSGEAAVAAFQSFQPDVVLLDAVMPGLDGFAACALIRALPDGQDVPILIITALNDPTAIDRAFQAGATDFLSKPFQMNVLNHRVRHLARARQAQALLHVRERAIAATTNGVIITDAQQPDNPIISVNPAFERLTGYTAEHLRGRNCRILQGPETDPETIAALRHAIAAGREIRAEILNYRQDGTSFWNDLTVTPVRDREGRLTHFVGVQQDMTERKRMEQALRESEARFRSVFTQTAVGTAIIGPDGRVIEVNRALDQMLGYAEREVLGQDFMAFSLPEDRAVSQACLESVRAGTLDSDTYENRYVRKDGRLLWGLLSFAAVRDEQGGLRYVVSQIQDITARKEAEDRLLQSEARMREAQRMGQIGSWDWMIGSKHVVWSDELYRIFHMQPTTEPPLLEEIITWVHPDDRDRVRAALRGAVQTRQSFREEHRLLLPDLQVRTVESIAEPVFDAHGELLRMAGTVQDITSRKQTAHALERLAERLGQLHAIAHAIQAVQPSPTIAATTLHQVRLLVACQWADIQLIDESTGATTVLAVDTDGAADLTPGVRSQLQALELRTELHEGKVVQIDALASQVGLAPPTLNPELKAIHSLLVVPLVAHQTLIGTLNLGTYHFGRFGEEDIAIAREVADLLAVALHNAQVYGRAQYARRVAEALQSASLDLAQSLELPTVLDRLVEHLGRLLPYDGARVMLLDDDGYLAYTYGHDFSFVPGEGQDATVRFDPKENATAHALVTHRRSVLVGDTMTDSNWERVPGREHVRNWLGVPLIAGGEVIGVYSFDKAVPNFFTPEHVKLAEAFAPHAALAVENSRLFAELTAGRARLQRLSQQLLEVQERERRHLARELHDQIGQVLTAIKMNLQMLGRDGHNERLDDTMDLVGQVLAEVRDLSLELRPSLLDDFGLVSALRWYIDREAQRTGYRATLVADPLERRLPPDLETTSFRIVQEALTNVVRHACATEVVVEVRMEVGQLRLIVRDNGSGFDVQVAHERARSGVSLGLLSMWERAELVGGTIEIRSEPNEGTTVDVRFPFTSATRAE